MQQQNNIPVIILCDGLGTRLQAVVNDVPKPMASINGKPFLHYIFKSLQQQKIQQVVLAVGYLKEKIQDFFQDNYLGIQIQYAVEQTPLGTGGGIKNAFDLVEDNAFVLNGDTFFEIDLMNLRIENVDIAMALKPMQNFDRYGTVEIDEQGNIKAFNEKRQCANGLINGGVYFINKSVFSKVNTEKKFSFENQILENQFHLLNIKGKIFDDYFIDIGIPEDYKKAQLHFR